MGANTILWKLIYKAGLIDSIMTQQLFLSVKATLLFVNIYLLQGHHKLFPDDFAVNIILGKLADTSYCWAKVR